MKKLLLVGLMIGAVFSAVNAMERPYSAPIMNKLTEEDVEVKFEFARGT